MYLFVDDKFFDVIGNNNKTNKMFFFCYNNGNLHSNVKRLRLSPGFIIFLVQNGKNVACCFTFIRSSQASENVKGFQL